MREPRNNIEYTCSDCLKKMYPRAGTFTPEEVLASTYVKANFDREHMWVEIVKVTDQGVVGTVANMPERPNSPPYGAKVFITFGNIEDIYKESNSAS
jgi:uncharacterized protein YegJ (DUF2314 family)